ncbi:MAG: hypothetical protein HY909_30000 [Deltaproteobacteria bacterium]|nr:hypothetical protein [Deltaproteobacteria bacterium]
MEVTVGVLRCRALAITTEGRDTRPMRRDRSRGRGADATWRAVGLAALAACSSSAGSGASGGDAAAELSVVDTTTPPGCPLPDGRTCPAGNLCAAGDRCNTCTCPPTGGAPVCTRAACADGGGAEASVDGGAPDAASPGCRRGADCGPGRMCHFPVTGCEALGRCEAPTPCAEPAEFCGCDGARYLACVPDRPTRNNGPCP